MEHCNSSIKYMITNVLTCISHHPVMSTDDASILSWKNDCESHWDLHRTYLSKKEQIYSDSILTMVLDGYQNLTHLVEEKKYMTSESWSLEDRKRNIEALVSRPQIAQRTESWYLDALGLLSASQF